jgi:hypothetical protein
MSVISQPLRIAARGPERLALFLGLAIPGLLFTLCAFGYLGAVFGSWFGAALVGGLIGVAGSLLIWTPLGFLVPYLRERVELVGTVLTVVKYGRRSVDLATAPQVWLTAATEATGYVSVGSTLVPTGHQQVPLMKAINEHGQTVTLRLRGASNGLLQPYELRTIAGVLRRNPSPAAHEVAAWMEYVAADPYRLLR